MMSTSPLLEHTRKEADQVVVPDTRELSPVLGVLWIVGTAAAWMVILVAFHFLMARSLGP